MGSKPCSQAQYGYVSQRMVEGSKSPISQYGKEPIRFGCGKIRTYLTEIS